MQMEVTHLYPLYNNYYLFIFFIEHQLLSLMKMYLLAMLIVLVK